MIGRAPEQSIHSPVLEKMQLYRGAVNDGVSCEIQSVI
jgi:hypothetical protein